MRAVLFAVFAIAIRAQTLPDPTDVLAHARDNMVERAKRLPNYTCVQTVDREYFVRSTRTPPYASCDQMSAAAARKKPYSLKVDATDRLRLDVKVSGGEEIGSWAGANRFDSRSIVDLVGGPFGSGQFGPLVLDVFVNIGTAFQYAGQDLQENSPSFHYTFQVPVAASHLMIRDREGAAGLQPPTMATCGSIRIRSICGASAFEPVSYRRKPRHAKRGWSPTTRGSGLTAETF
jgi:hypothetical protein